MDAAWSGPSSSSIDTDIATGIMLLVPDAWLSTQVQYFAPLCKKTKPGPAKIMSGINACYMPFPDSIPFNASMLLCNPRINKYTKTWECIKILNCDEIGLDLIAKGSAAKWRIQALECAELP